MFDRLSGSRVWKLRWDRTPLDLDWRALRLFSKIGARPCGKVEAYKEESDSPYLLGRSGTFAAWEMYPKWFSGGRL